MNCGLRIADSQMKKINKAWSLQSAVFGGHDNPPSAIRNPPSDSGYALVSLLVFMSLLALFALAAAPQVQQQGQREREKEAIFRGQQVADAIGSYYRFKGAQGVNSLPTSIDQLLEGIPRGTKKLQILRPEAAHDPLSSSGEWRIINPTSQDFAQYISALTTYVGGAPPPPSREFGALANLIPRVTDVLDTKSSGTAPGGEDNSDNSSGPFLGVSSRSRRNSVITFYGIDRHDEWIFTPLFR
jgi:type II secretory pathway pseudopilin PulG